MIIFKVTKSFNRDKKQLEKLLKDRILKLTQSPLYFFPFCLFSKSFYIDLKESRKGYFEGEINNEHFDLSLTSKVFSTRTRLPLTIKGEIQNNSIQINYKIPNIIIIVAIALVIIDLLFIKYNNQFDNVFYLIAGLLIITYFLKIIRISNVIDRVCR